MNASLLPPATPSTQTRIRVLEVVGNGIVGGMETWVLRMAQHLPAERFEVTALCPYEGALTERLRAAGVTCHVSPLPDGDPAWATLQMTSALVQAQGIDVLHAHLPNAHLHAALVGRLTGRPVVATIHGRQMSTIDLEIHRLAGTHVSTVCQQSYFHALGLGVEPSRLSCITNGVDTTAFVPRVDAARKAQARIDLLGPERAQALGDAPLVGFIGRLSPEKGPEVFVRAALLLRTRLPAARCVMVGEGPMLAAVQALVSQYGLDDHVWLLGLREDMPAVYHALDVMASTSHSEAMPLAVMEAMASGLPVVATRVGGVPDLVEHGRTGWVVTAGNFESVATQTALLMSNDADRERMGRRARDRAVAQFELRHSIERVGRLLARVGTPVGTPLGGPRRLAGVAHDAVPLPAGALKAVP